MQKGETLVDSWDAITSALFGDCDILQIQVAEQLCYFFPFIPPC